jgi:hypothetical protein
VTLLFNSLKSGFQTLATGMRGRETKTKDYFIEDAESIDLLGDGTKHVCVF